MSLDAEKDSKSISFDAALAKTGLGRFHVLLLLTSGLCLMSTIVETMNVGFVIPLIEMECELPLSLSQKGVLNGSAFIGVVLSSFCWGFLADWEKGGRKKVMHSCASLAFVFSFISSFSINVWMLIITKFFVGFFISGIAANTYAFLGEFHCEKQRAKYLSFAGVFMAFALTFCPGVGWLILKFQHLANFTFVIPLIDMKYSIWRIFLLLCSLLSGFVTILLFYLPESPKFLLAQGRHDEALEILKEINRRNKGKNSIYPVEQIHLNEELLVKERQNSSVFTQFFNQTKPLFQSPLLMSTLKTSFVMFSLFAASSGFFLWTPDILNKLIEYKAENYTVCGVVDRVIHARQHQNVPNDCKAQKVDENIYEITFFMGVFFSFIYFVNGLIIYRTGKRNLLAFWFILCGVAGVAIPWTGDYYMILVLLLIFLTSGVCGSLLSAVLVDIFPTNVRAMSLCVVLMFGRLGGVAGSNFVSFTIESQCELMFGVFGGILIASAVISCLLPEKKVDIL